MSSSFLVLVWPHFTIREGRVDMCISYVDIMPPFAIKGEGGREMGEVVGSEIERRESRKPHRNGDVVRKTR